MNNDFRIYSSPLELAEVFANELVTLINNASGSGRKYAIALSGGNTPQLLFSVLAAKHSESVDWNAVHFFWVDERCVAPDDIESNFGNARRLLFDKITIPADSIHRMRGEEDPAAEAVRYSEEIKRIIGIEGILPVFDHIVLGLGDDGHTASIFPENIELINSDKICEVSTHPKTGQKRITLTGKVINHGRKITFLVTGENKARIVNEIFQKHFASKSYPASHIMPLNGTLTWLLDEKAAGL
jgi:6-phosphogluconolactonase